VAVQEAKETERLGCAGALRGNREQNILRHPEHHDARRCVTSRDERARLHPGGIPDNSPGQVRHGGRSPGLRPRENLSPGALRMTPRMRAVH
jgi:hypothetical protein